MEEGVEEGAGWGGLCHGERAKKSFFRLVAQSERDPTDVPMWFVFFFVPSGYGDGGALGLPQRLPEVATCHRLWLTTT